MEKIDVKFVAISLEDYEKLKNMNNIIQKCKDIMRGALIENDVKKDPINVSCELYRGIKFCNEYFLKNSGNGRNIEYMGNS